MFGSILNPPLPPKTNQPNKNPSGKIIRSKPFCSLVFIIIIFFFLGNYFASHFFMGGEKFDTPHPEGYLFGENMDLNFLGNRPVQASSCILSMLHFSAQKASSSDFPVGTWRYFGAHRCLMRLEKAACSSDLLVLWEQAVALSRGAGRDFMQGSCLRFLLHLRIA